MKPSLLSLRFIAKMFFAGMMMSSSAIAQDVLEHLRTTAEAEVAMADAEGKLKKMDLAQKYATALGNLEKSLAAAGELDAIVHLREEQEAVRGTGEPTPHDDKPLVDLRAKYLKSRDDIDAATKGARAQVAQGTGKKIKEQEAVLTKAGKVEEALNLRKEGERLLLQLSGGSAAETVAFADDPRANSLPALNDLEMIKLPPDKPPVADNPFAIKGDWLTSMTVPVAKQKVREPIIVGHREKNIWITVVVSPNSIWSGAERGKVHLAAGTFIATKSRFENLELGADHANRFYFANCAFTSCKFPKVGWWHDGGWFFAKHYFENCHIKGSYAGRLTVQENGIRAQTCVFEDVEFPTIRFQKHQPADFVNDKWLRLVNCRFVKCKLPLSFLLLTRDCVFENCVVSEDIDRGDDVEITKPIQIDMYVSNTQIRVNKMPAAVTINQKKYSDPKVAAVPTAASLTALMAK
ncbi:hypothetical protein JIN84_08180 [Luteolibacter yonseiensis]|uniref:Right handed beta helix domain-containing protein n=1 Tax=Luteolibacter yonseiensis TaxID=1144680 RepID=A0A934VBM8_9BACT|nr:hypothetical protein [Luteolibacter yonseiensis]MBK1815589.1 hypothetical protein [Luteolibacter yonseiensis]